MFLRVSRGVKYPYLFEFLFRNHRLGIVFVRSPAYSAVHEYLYEMLSVRPFRDISRDVVIQNRYLYPTSWPPTFTASGRDSRALGSCVRPWLKMKQPQKMT